VGKNATWEVNSKEICPANPEPWASEVKPSKSRSLPVSDAVSKLRVWQGEVTALLELESALGVSGVKGM
jgi:hypothetical protein